MTIVQWNARSLSSYDNWAKVADFQKFLESFEKILEILCIQETWNHTGQKELKIPDRPTQQPTADPKASMVAGKSFS